MRTAAVMFAVAVCGAVGACSSSETNDESASADDCQAAWTIAEQLRMQRQLADGDFSELQNTLDASLDEIDSSVVSSALNEISDGLDVYATGPSPTDGYAATLHIDHALASLGLACVESSPDLRYV